MKKAQRCVFDNKKSLIILNVLINVDKRQHNE